MVPNYFTIEKVINMSTAFIGKLIGVKNAMFVNSLIHCDFGPIKENCFNFELKDRWQIRLKLIWRSFWRPFLDPKWHILHIFFWRQVGV
jgi:hypothetical protein